MPQMSQGATLNWGGAVGSVTGITVTPRSANLTDISSMNSESIGSGETLRIVNQQACFAVDPGDATVKFLGVAFSTESVGLEQALTISIGGETISGNAVLESFEWEAAVGELVRGTAKFKFTGS